MLFRSVWRSVKGLSRHILDRSGERSAVFHAPLDSRHSVPSCGYAANGKLMRTSAPHCRLAIVRTEPPPLVTAIRQIYAGRSPLHPPPLQKADVGFALWLSTAFDRAGTQPRVQGWRFSQKILPVPWRSGAPHSLAEGKADSLPLLPHGECGAWGKAPQLKFRDGVRPPFTKGVEDWGELLCRLAQISSGQRPSEACSRHEPTQGY